MEDIMAPAPEALPPFREVNHRINILNPAICYMERRPTCPQVLEMQLREKLARYDEQLGGYEDPYPMLAH